MERQLAVHFTGKKSVNYRRYVFYKWKKKNKPWCLGALGLGNIVCRLTMRSVIF